MFIDFCFNIYYTLLVKESQHMSKKEVNVMYSRYLITGATGFLGRAVTKELLKGNGKISALVLENDKLNDSLPPDVNVVKGDVCSEAALEKFFEGAGGDTCVIHCAGIVSVASNPGKKIYDVNVGGTQNIIKQCISHSVGKLIYVSSVHAIPEKKKGVPMDEVCEFSPTFVHGDYAKSKAAATIAVLDAAKRGLNVNVVFPSGIIGPEDGQCGSVTNMLILFLKGKLPVAVRGGYDFVDVRDVAKGIVSCAENGKSGKCYILSGHYASVKDILNEVKRLSGIKRTVLYLPSGIAKMISYAFEKSCLKHNKPLYFTPYSIDVLRSNALFLRKNAEEDLDYSPRSIAETLRDTLLWINNSDMVSHKHKKRAVPTRKKTMRFCK